MRAHACLFALALIATTSRVAHAAPESEPEKIPRGQTVFFAAELGTTPDILGMGFERDLSLEDANGDAHRVFQNKTIEVPVNHYDCNFERVDNDFSLAVHTNLLFLQAGVKVSKSKRYMVVRASQVTKMVKLVKEGRAVANAPMYASKIYYGWALYIVIEGDSTAFTAEVATALMNAGPKLATEISERKLTSHVHLIGLKAKQSGHIPIAITVDDVQSNFEESPTPQPIFVEYSLMQDFVVDSVPWAKNEMKPGRYAIDVDLDVMPSKANGKSWDAGSNPDPLVKLIVNDREETSCKQQDSLESRCLHGRIIEIDEDTSISLRAVDADLANDDWIGETKPITLIQAGLVPGAQFSLSTLGQIRSAKIMLTPVR